MDHLQLQGSNSEGPGAWPRPSKCHLPTCSPLPLRPTPAASHLVGGCTPCRDSALWNLDSYPCCTLLLSSEMSCGSCLGRSWASAGDPAVSSNPGAEQERECHLIVECGGGQNHGGENSREHLQDHAKVRGSQLGVRPVLGSWDTLERFLDEGSVSG